MKMGPISLARLRKIATATTGSEIAEAALVLPILFMLLLGIYLFGRAFNVYATINHAAREGARLGTASTCATCSATPNQPPSADSIAAQVALALQASHLDPSQVTNLGASRTACGGGSASCTLPAAGNPQICVYYNVQLPITSPASSGAPACGTAVEFRYPYQFLVPFTSLNMETITLNAGVQMTGEY